MPEKLTTVTVSDSKSALDTALSAKIADKAVRDFCLGVTGVCYQTVDAKQWVLADSTYDKTGGWTTLPDGQMFHEISREVVKKYALVPKPIYDSYYFHVFADGTSKLLTHAENWAEIAKQKQEDVK